MVALALIALLSGSAAAPVVAGTSVEVSQLTVTRSIIIRVPARRAHRADPPLTPLQDFNEHKGPRCIEADAIGAAAISAPDSVDFIVRGGKRLRARLEDACPALDYYSGFYVKPPPDGKICAGRDSIHTRSGGDCQIDKFRLLTPKAPR